MKAKWYQITLSGILWATFWMGVCFGAFVLIDVDFVQADTNIPLGILLVSVGVLSPFVAVGALFRRPWIGLLVGIALVGLYAAVWSLALYYGIISFP